MGKKTVINSLVFSILMAFSAQSSVCGEESWHRILTDNFTLIGNADRKQILKVGLKLEEYREALRRVAPELTPDSPISTTVIVFRDQSSFRPFKPVNARGRITEWVSGYFQAGHDKNYIVISLNSKNVETYQTIFHEYAHYLIDYNIGRTGIPPWYSEGLAEYYDRITIEDGNTVRIGSQNKNHLRILRTTRLIPLERFFSLDYKNLRLENETEANLFYAQSWALMHYFMREQTGVRKLQLDKFVKLILRKNKPEDAFREIFGLSFRELENKLLSHIQAENFQVSEIKFKAGLTSGREFLIDELSKALVYSYLGDLLYQRGRYSEAEEYLLGALKQNPDHSFANSTLGLTKFKQNQFIDAKIYLKKGVECADADYLAFFRYAFFLSREVIGSGKYVTSYSDERAKEMRRNLSKSISFNPKFADNYYLLGFIDLVRNENFEEGIRNLLKALELSPKNQIYQINLAELYVRNKDFHNGRSLAEAIILHGDDERIRNRAERILKKIEFIEEVAARNQSHETNINSIKLRNNPRVLTEAELERNRRQTANEKINEVLRKPESGEKRILGRILSINCPKGKVVFSIGSDGRLTKLTSPDFNQLLLWTYAKEMRGVSVGCGTDLGENLAVLTYRAANQNAPTAEIIAIEFVPGDFVLSLLKQKK